MTSFEDFQQEWKKKFPREEAPTAGWEDDIRTNLQKHRERLENLKQEVEKEEFYVKFLESSLENLEKAKCSEPTENQPGFVTVIQISNKEKELKNNSASPQKPSAVNYENVEPNLKAKPVVKIPPKPLAKSYKRWNSEENPAIDSKPLDAVAWTKQQIQQLSVKSQRLKEKDDLPAAELRHAGRNYENVGTRNSSSSYENIFPESGSSNSEKHASLPVTNLDEDQGRVRRAALSFQQRRSHSVQVLPAQTTTHRAESAENLYDSVSREDLAQNDNEGDYVYLEKQEIQSEEDRFDNSTLGSQKSLSSTDNSSVGSLNRLYANLTSLDDPEWPKTGKSRHPLILQNLLESEEVFVDTLDMLLQYRKALIAALNSSPIISAEEINTIFHLVPQLHEQHFAFVQTLQQSRNIGWDLTIVVKKLLQISQECLVLYSGYLHNYPKAVEATQAAVQKSQQFAKLARDIKTRNRDQPMLTSIEEMLHKPVARVQRHVAVLKDLKDNLSPDNANWGLLDEAQRLTRTFLREFDAVQLCSMFPTPSGKLPGNGPVQRHLVRNGFLVELLTDGTRKQRHVFLFTDLMVCTKYKSAANGSPVLEVKWYAPLSSLTAQTEDTGSSKNLNVSAMTNVMTLKAQAASLRSQMQRSASAVEKHRKKLASLEAKLLLDSPNLPLKISYKPKGSRSNHSHTFLLSSNYERSVWLEAIHIQQQTCRVLEQVALEEVDSCVKSCRSAVEPPLGFAKNSALPAINGELHVVVHTLKGLPKPADTCVILEVDSYGHYFHKASTKLVCNSSNPNWEEDFNIELEGTRGLRALLYQDEGQLGHVLRGKTEIELSLPWLQNLKGPQYYPLSVQLGSGAAGSGSLNREVTLCLTLKYISHDLTLRRPVLRKTSAGIFGVPVDELCEREKRPVPYLVMSCVREIERRGLQELGIYRVSGSATDIAKLRKAFESQKQDCDALLREVDIHSVSGLLKLYLRQLPEALFTDKLYPQFVQAFASLDNDDLVAGSGTANLIQLFSSLPQVNQNVIVYILEHLVRVNNAEVHNKMSTHNLATVFGPNLLRPATPSGFTENQQVDLLTSGTVDVMAQAGILHFFLLRRVRGEPIQSLNY